MKPFIQRNLSVTNIEFADFIPSGMGATGHKNRSSHGLALNINGEKIYRFENGGTQILKSYDFIYLPKYSSYTVEGTGDIYCINFQLTETEQFPPFVLHLKHPGEALQAYQNAKKLWKSRKDGFEFLCKAELYKLLYVFQGCYASRYEPRAKKELLAPAISYVHNHYDSEPISMEKLSKLCGFSYEYFRRLFHGVYGCSPVQYVNDLKLKRVKELLSSGYYSVSEAATLSGFFDTSYFSRFFKKQVGITANDYLKRNT